MAAEGTEDRLLVATSRGTTTDRGEAATTVAEEATVAEGPRATLGTARGAAATTVMTSARTEYVEYMMLRTISEPLIPSLGFRLFQRPRGRSPSRSPPPRRAPRSPSRSRSPPPRRHRSPLYDRARDRPYSPDPRDDDRRRRPRRYSPSPPPRDHKRRYRGDSRSPSPPPLRAREADRVDSRSPPPAPRRRDRSRSRDRRGGSSGGGGGPPERKVSRWDRDEDAPGASGSGDQGDRRDAQEDGAARESVRKGCLSSLLSSAPLCARSLH